MESHSNHDRERFARRGGKKRILIVEDDPDLWSLLQRFSLRLDPGFIVDFSEGPADAVEQLKGGHRYDAVVSDFCLPKPGDGYALRTEVESTQPWARFGMISALMGFAPKDVPYLAKPFTPQQYRSFLGELVA